MPTLSHGLMNLATRAGRQAANRQLLGTGSLLGRLGGALGRAARDYGGMARRLFRPARQEALDGLQELARGVRGRSSVGAPPVSWPSTPPVQSVQAPERQYAPATQALQSLADDILGRSSINDLEADQLAQRVLALLRHAKADPAVAVDSRRALEDILVWLEHRFQPPAGGGVATDDAEDDIEVLGRADLGAYPDAEEFVQGETRTPGSSNVYSYFWKPDVRIGARNPAKANTNGTLFVTFKAWWPGAKEKSDQAGPTYAYSNVPMGKYMEFEKAASGSAGGAVWDYLRVRGSRYGHQHPYRLVAGVPVPEGGEYVPRKATRKGFQSRTLVNPRAGTRQGSTLGEDLLPESQWGANYSYAQWREIARERSRGVDRAGVDRGGVDRGR